jgi:hypothetical protein
MTNREKALEEALRPFANYACDPPCECNNCRARAALTLPAETVEAGEDVAELKEVKAAADDLLMWYSAIVDEAHVSDKSAIRKAERRLTKALAALHPPQSAGEKP